jgi:hypothetical protein
VERERERLIERERTTDRERKKLKKLELKKRK